MDEMIGQKLTYSSNGQSEWIVFGRDEDENVLITTKEPINTNYEVSRTVESWLDYEDNLNAACSGYGATIQGKTVTSRSITLKDINYVSGYTEPERETYTFGIENNYTNNKVDYLYPKKGASTTIGDKTYTNWMKATNASEAQAFEQNLYSYYYIAGSNSENTDDWDVANGDETIHIKDYLNSNKLKFIWGDGGNQYNYAVASRSVGVGNRSATFRIARVKELGVALDILLTNSYSNGASDYGGNYQWGLRPVVVLPPDIKVEEKEGIYDIAY